MDLITLIIISFSVIVLVILIEFIDIVKRIIYLIIGSFFFYELSLNIDNILFSQMFLKLSIILLILIPLITIEYYIEKLLIKKEGKNE